MCGVSSWLIEIATLSVLNLGSPHPMAVPWKRRKLEPKYIVTREDEAMIQFVSEAFADHDAFESELTLDQDVLGCFEWISDKSEAESISRRESMMQAKEYQMLCCVYRFGDRKSG